MRRVGIILILAGLSLIGALSLDIAKKDQSVAALGSYASKRHFAPIKLFSTISTILIIAGVSVTVLDKNTRP